MHGRRTKTQERRTARYIDARSALVAAAMVGVLSACAPKTVVVPTVAGAPRFPEFVQPVAPTGQSADPFARQNDQAWQYLQAGDLRGADRELALLLKTQPEYFPAQTTSAYVALAKKDNSAAAVQFTRVTDAHPDYAPALVGKGLALLAGERNSEAIDAFRAAVQADPSLTDIARRVDVLTLRALQDELASARQAARSGQLDVAMRAYRSAIAASPDSAFLYRELAAVERQRGQTREAIDHLRRSNSLDPQDAGSLALLGDLLEHEGELASAVTAYTEALRVESDPAVDARRAAVRARLDLAALPNEYQAIEQNAQITRADLAALIGVGLAPLVQTAPSRDASVITDIRGHWAERWITPVARAGLVDAFVNHTFQPRTIVRRADLAQSVAKLLNLIAVSDPTRARQWVGARRRFPDVPPGHLAYAAVSATVAAGVMTLAADGSFGPTQPVTGAEAAAAISRVRALGRFPAGVSDRP